MHCFDSELLEVNVDQHAAISANVQCQPPGGIILQRILNTCIGRCSENCIVIKAMQHRLVCPLCTLSQCVGSFFYV